MSSNLTLSAQIHLLNFFQKTKFPKESSPGDRHTADFGNKLVDVYKLIHLAKTKSSEVVSLQIFEKLKLNDYWKDSNDQWISIYEILTEAGKYKDKPDWKKIVALHPSWKKEIEKIIKADYSKYPLLVIGENYVIDGMHRLVKAWIEKADEIPIKRFQELPEETIILERE